MNLLRKNDSKVRFCFDSDFYIGQKKVVEKIKSEELIKIVGKNVYGEDFYYGYYVKDDTIVYYLFNGKGKVEEGCFPVFAKALIEEGIYYYKYENIYYVFKNERGEIKTYTSFTKPVNGKELPIEDDFPDTLKTRWSFKKKADLLTVIAIISVLIGLLFLFLYPAKKKVVMPKIVVKVQHAEKPYLPDIGKLFSFIETVGKKYGKKVDILKITYSSKKKKCLIRLKFADEQILKNFLTTYGGVNEGKLTVVYSFDCGSGGSSSDSGRNK